MIKQRSSRQILAENLAKLMSSRPELDSQPKVAARSGLGQTSISRLLRQDASATTDSLDQIARAFGMEPWQLLVRGLEPFNMPRLKTVPERELELLDRLRLAAQDLVEYKSSPIVKK